MNLTRIISIKERIALGDWKPDERDFILEAINMAVGYKMLTASGIEVTRSCGCVFCDIDLAPVGGMHSCGTHSVKCTKP